MEVTNLDPLPGQRIEEPPLLVTSINHPLGPVRTMLIDLYRPRCMERTFIQIPASIALSSPLAHPASARTRSRHREAVSGSAMATIKLPLPTVSLLLLLVLLLSAAWMPPKASAQPSTCSIELDSSGCNPKDCVKRCAHQYRGVGECAHQEYVSNYHCVCLYTCF